MPPETTLKITQRRSGYGQSLSRRETLRSLGLGGHRLDSGSLAAQPEHRVDGEAAQLRDLLRAAQVLEARDRRLDEVDRVL